MMGGETTEVAVLRCGPDKLVIYWKMWRGSHVLVSDISLHGCSSSEAAAVGAS